MIMSTEEEYQPSEQVFCTIIACLGSLIAGYSVAWPSPGSRILTNPEYFPPVLITSNDQLHWIFMWLPIGAVVGALLAGLLVDVIGRKLILLFSTITCTAVWVVTMLAYEIYILYIARLIMGIIVGIYTVVIPLYIIDISEDSRRGRLGTYFYLFFTLGELLDHILGIFNSYFILCFVVTILAVIFLFSQLFIPESPMYLVKNNRQEEAIYNLKRLRNPHDCVELEIEDLHIYLLNAMSDSSSFGRIFTMVNAKSLFIAICLMIFHQVGGFNVEFILSNTAGVSETISIIILACLQSLFTIVACILADKAGRKILLIISAVITSASLFALGFYFWSLDWTTDDVYLQWMLLISLMTYISGFSIGLGPLPWVVVPEILAPEIKSFGIGVVVSVNWLCFSLLPFIYQSIEKISIFSYILYIFSAVTVISLFFTAFVVVETNKKSLQQIQDKLIGLPSNQREVPK